MTRAVDVTVTGRGQGVAYRHHAQEQARRLGVTGWVRNEPDGSVVAHLEGEEVAVGSLVAWCREGPPYARVSGVDVRASEPTGARDFEVHG